MYLYFDNVGNLKEIINDIPLRVGAHNVNDVYLYWEAYSNDYTSMQVSYHTPDDITSTDTINISVGGGTYVENEQIPYDKKRDLLFFKYGKDYDFIKFTIPTEVLLIPGLLTINFLMLKAGEQFPLDTNVNLMVNGSKEIKPQQHCSIADYTDLLNAIGGKQNVLTAGNGIDITSDTISADYTNTTFTNLLKALLTPTMFSASIVYENELLFTYNGENKIGILTFGNTFTILPLYNLTSGTMYKTSGTFVYDENGSVKTTTINFSYDSENSKLRVWSGDRNYHFANGYTAYLFGITLY